MKKILALLIIATILMSIPLVAAANTKPSLSKVLFIHRREDFAKPPWAGNPGGPPSDGENDYYEFLMKGLKWRELPVEYVIDPDNPDELPEEFVFNAISAGAEEWDDNTRAELFATYSIDYAASFDLYSPDGRNELLFDDWPEAEVIAVTVVWYFGRTIIEFDIMFDTDFTWGDADGDTNVMDLQNIATHEFGHGAGLADLYAPECSEQTMYGYATYGETKKRTLNTGDIAGIQKLYR